jgi:azurin
MTTTLGLAPAESDMVRILDKFSDLEYLGRADDRIIWGSDFIGHGEVQNVLNVDDENLTKAYQYLIDILSSVSYLIR